MNIGISTSVIQRGKTGIAQYLFSLLRTLIPRCRQHSITLFVLEEDVPLFDFVKDHMRIVTVDEKFRPAVRNIAWHQTELPRLARLLELEVLHVPSYRRMLWRRPCALVATIHDLAPFRVARKYSPLRMFYGRVIARHLAHRQHEVIAISHNTARDLQDYFGLDEERITVIHNGIDHVRFAPGSTLEAKSALSARHGITDPFFLYVARLEHPAKNHVRLIEAFERFKAATRSPWKLVFAGSDWHGAEQIHQAISASPVRGEIRSLGFIPDIDLPELYRAADVFLYPSLYEGFGLPPLEAMACGTPVICSTRGSLHEVIGCASRRINPENVADMLMAMRELAESPSRRETLRLAGFQQASQFRWEKAADATFKVYQKAINRRNAMREKQSVLLESTPSVTPFEAHQVKIGNLKNGLLPACFPSDPQRHF